MFAHSDIHDAHNILKTQVNRVICAQTHTHTPHHTSFSFALCSIPSLVVVVIVVVAPFPSL